MIEGIERIPLTKEYILQRCSEEQIYEFYWKKFKVGHIYTSPFRKDSTPSFGIYRTKTGHLRHHDYGKEEFSGNCFSFISQMYQLDLETCLSKINTDLCLNSGKIISITPLVSSLEEYKKEPVKINILAKKFTLDDLKYWNQYAQDISDLKRNDVYSVDKLWIQGKKIDLEGDLCFAYLFLGDKGEEYLKIYRPYTKNKVNKWKNNTPNTLISGWNRATKGGNRLIIVGSKKDEMCIQKLTMDCCSTQNESKTALTPENIKLLKEKWNRIIIGYDPDEAGVSASTYYTKTYGLDYVNVPKNLYKSGVKDWSDFIEAYGVGQLQYYLQNHHIL